MIDFSELMRILSLPRPNGSPAERQVRLALLDWMDRHGITHHTFTFRLYPHFFKAIGIWLILSRTLLALAIWLRWGWASLVIALVGLPGGLVDVALGIPLITWPGAVSGENILLEFTPSTPRQEIVLTAHYDTKTELLDHRQRMFFLKNLRMGILLTMILGLLGPVDAALLQVGSSWSSVTFWIGVLLTLPLLLLAWGLGLNLTLGRLRMPSQGAVDNGAACAILLGLADRLSRREIPLERSKITIALFTGEEVNMQGSRAYVVSRDWPLPTIALNLEVMAQDGEYVFWEQDGTSLRLVPTSPQVNAAITTAVQEVTGSPARPVGPVNSDGGSFLLSGIPATTLGSYDLALRDRGFHSSSDNLERIVMERLPQGIEILARFIHNCEKQGLPVMQGKNSQDRQDL